MVVRGGFSGPLCDRNLLDGNTVWGVGRTRLRDRAEDERVDVVPRHRPHDLDGQRPRLLRQRWTCIRSRGNERFGPACDCPGVLRNPAQVVHGSRPLMRPRQGEDVPLHGHRRESLFAIAAPRLVCGAESGDLTADRIRKTPATVRRPGLSVRAFHGAAVCELGRDRTCDNGVNGPALYHLSYQSMCPIMSPDRESSVLSTAGRGSKLVPLRATRLRRHSVGSGYRQPRRSGEGAGIAPARSLSLCLRTITAALHPSCRGLVAACFV